MAIEGKQFLEFQKKQRGSEFGDGIINKRIG